MAKVLMNWLETVFEDANLSIFFFFYILLFLAMIDVLAIIISPQLALVSSNGNSLIQGRATSYTKGDEIIFFEKLVLYYMFDFLE